MIREYLLALLNTEKQLQLQINHAAVLNCCVFVSNYGIIQKSMQFFILRGGFS